MLPKAKILDEFGEATYVKAFNYYSEGMVKDLKYKVKNDIAHILGVVQVDGEAYNAQVKVNLDNDEVVSNSCSCNKGKNCEHVLSLIIAANNIASNAEQRYNTEQSQLAETPHRKIIPLEVILDLTSFRENSSIKIKFDLADKKLAKSPKNYIYEYIIDSVRHVKVTPEDDIFLRKLIHNNNIYTYPDDGISLSMSQFINLFDAIREHPRVYVVTENGTKEKVTFSDETFVPKLRIRNTQDKETKKIAVETLEDYSKVIMISNGNIKKVVIRNSVYNFSNPIPIENWLIIFENRFKISEKDFPKFFGKFLPLLKEFAQVEIEEEIVETKLTIVDPEEVEIFLFFDYKEEIEKLYWEPMITYKGKTISAKKLFEPNINHIEIDESTFISNIKELKQRVVSMIDSIRLSEYFFQSNHVSQYANVKKDFLVRKLFYGWKFWLVKVVLSENLVNILPREVKIVFDVDIESTDDKRFNFHSRAFLLDSQTSEVVSEIPLKEFLGFVDEIPSDGIITIHNRYYKIKNSDEVVPIVNKLKDFVEEIEKEKGISKLIKTMILEDEIYSMVNSKDTFVINKKGKTLELLKEMRTMKPSVLPKIPEEVSDIMREYQKIGFYWLSFLYKHSFGGILADDMGLGKTLQALAFIKYISEQEEHLPSLVICPTSLVYNWAREIEKFFPSMKYGIAVGKPSEREYVLENFKNYQIIITSFPIVRNDIDLYKNKKFKVVVVDEAQYIKNKEAKTTKLVKMIDSNIKIALTGTPIENSIADLWSIFDFVLPGFFENYTNFMQKYSKPENQKELVKRIYSFILRRKKENVLKELPSKIEQNVFCEMDPKQREIYEYVLRDLRMNILEKVSELGFEKSKIHIFSALTKLRQICNHPYLVSDNYQDVTSGKLELLMDLLNDAIESEHKILVFSQFVEMLKIIENQLKKDQIDYSYLDGSTRNRQEIIDEFNQNNEKKVFLISLKAGGFGINLTSADVVILYDPWWNPMIEKQAMDRVHRIGQTKTVNVYKLVTQNSIEEKILKLQDSKKLLFDNIIEESSSMLNNLSWEEIKKLFE